MPSEKKMIRSAVGVSEIKESQVAGRAATKKAIGGLDGPTDLLMVFSSSDHDQDGVISGVNSVAGDAVVVGYSTAGEIVGDEKNVYSGSVTVTAFKLGDVRLVTAEAGGAKKDSHATGKGLAEKIVEKNGGKPSFMMVLIEGLAENGAAVVRGIQEVLGDDFPIMGGSAGDDFKFEKTYQYHEGRVITDSVVGIALTGDISFGMGVKHGWEPISLPMTVTRAEAAVLKEVDGKPAISIYEEYFGKRAEELVKEPFTRMAYTYPLGIAVEGMDELIIRNVVIANEKGEIIAAADTPEGSRIRLMIGDRYKAIEAARTAAQSAMAALKKEPKTAIIFNCIARKRLLGIECKTEVEAVREVIDRNVPIVGFYAYGEVGPFEANGGRSVFHNGTINLLLLG